MPKVFNTTAVCIPEEHYMVDISGRLEEIKSLVDAGKYFTINRARQYGKTTTLRALYRYLQKEYYVVLLDFQTFDNDKFENGMFFGSIYQFIFAVVKKKYSFTRTGRCDKKYFA